MNLPYPRAQQILLDALATRQASGIALYLKKGGGEGAFYLGQTAHPETGAAVAPVTEHTYFDLASLTKILSTLPLLLDAEAERLIRFQDPVRKYFPHFPAPDTTLQELLLHKSGLVNHEKFFQRVEQDPALLGRQDQLAEWICRAEFLHERGTEYSDLGHMLFGLLLEKVFGKNLPALFRERVAQVVGVGGIGFQVLAHAADADARAFRLENDPKQFAATEKCPWRKKVLQGEVHDDNTWALGGYAGHAGLFGRLTDTARVFQHLVKLLRTRRPELRLTAPTSEKFLQGLMVFPGLRPYRDPQEAAFRGAIGHTGFVGTSAWYHAPTDTTVVLLANRVHPSRDDGRWIDTRLEFHRVLWHESHRAH